MAYRFKLGPALGKELVRVVGERIERAIQAINDRHAGLAERVHVARTSCKRIRAALRLVRSIEPQLWQWENAWFRDAARELAPLREAAVMPQTFSELLRNAGHRIDPKDFADLRRELGVVRRKTLGDAASNEEIISRFHERMREARRRCAKLKIKADATAVITRGFGESYRGARRAWRRAGARQSTTAFHDYRKRAKDCGYHCRLFRFAWPALMVDWQRELSQLGDRLGEEHDLAVLDDWLRKATPRREKKAIAELRGAIRSRRDELRKHSLLLGARLFAEKRGEAACRLSRWWQAATALERTDAATRASKRRQ